MAGNLVQKRAKKAQRRKLLVAEKRKAEALETSLPARVLRASRAPIQHCLLSEPLFDDGIGTMILARGEAPDDVAFGSFLVDVFCLGIKDVMFEVDSEAFRRTVDAMDLASPLVAVEPDYARKLLCDLAHWSRSIGFEPHAEFAVVERLFGDVSADANDAVFEFGRAGKPLYIPGPTESPATVRRRLEHLRRVLGDDGFDLDSAA